VDRTSVHDGLGKRCPPRAQQGRKPAIDTSEDYPLNENNYRDPYADWVSDGNNGLQQPVE
jgi:hypothetical protein